MSEVQNKTVTAKVNLYVYKTKEKEELVSVGKKKAEVKLMPFTAPIDPKARKGNGIACHLSVTELAKSAQPVYAYSEASVSVTPQEAKASYNEYFDALGVDPKVCGEGTVIFFRTLAVQK